MVAFLDRKRPVWFEPDDPQQHLVQNIRSLLRHSQLLTSGSLTCRHAGPSLQLWAVGQKQRWPAGARGGSAPDAPAAAGRTDSSRKLMLQFATARASACGKQKTEHFREQLFFFLKQKPGEPREDASVVNNNHVLYCVE